MVTTSCLETRGKNLYEITEKIISKLLQELKWE